MLELNKILQKKAAYPDDDTSISFIENAVPNNIGGNKYFDPTSSAIGAATVPTVFYTGTKAVPSYVSRLIGGKELADKFNNAYYDKFLTKLPFMGEKKPIKRTTPAKIRMANLKGKGKLGALLLGLGALGGVGAGYKGNVKIDQDSNLNNLINTNQNDSQLDPSYSSNVFRDNPLLTMGGTTALGTILGTLLKGDSDSNMAPILGGLAGLLSGYGLSKYSNERKI